MFGFTTAEKEVGEEARRGEEEQVENEVENENEELERMGKAVILPSHLPSPASDEEEQLLQESATGDKVTKGEEEEEGSGQSRVVKFEEGSGEGSGKGAIGSGPKVIGNDATDAMEKPKQEKSVSGGADTNRSSNLHQKSGLLFIVVAAIGLSK